MSKESYRIQGEISIFCRGETIIEPFFDFPQISKDLDVSFSHITISGTKGDYTHAIFLDYKANQTGSDISQLFRDELQETFSLLESRSTFIIRTLRISGAYFLSEVEM